MPDNSTVIEVPVGATGATSAPYEVPFNADITDVTAVTTAAVTTADMIVDIQKNGTSVFATAIGTVATIGKTAQGAGAGMASGDTTLYLEFAGNGAPDIQAGATLLIGTEEMTVTAQSQGGSGLVTGGVQGSSQVDGATPVYKIGVTRAANGTAAAAHAAGASVFPAKPRVAVGAQKSATTANPGYGPTPLLTEGDVLTVVTSGGFATGTGTVAIELQQR